MADSDRSLAIARATYLGAVVLVGGPTYMGINWILTEVLSDTGLADPAGPAGYAVLGVAVVIALQAAVEAAALQLHGVGAVWRGSRAAVAVRLVAIGAGITILLGFGMLSAIGLVVGGYGALETAFGVLLALTVVGVLALTGRAFLTGYRGRAF